MQVNGFGWDEQDLPPTSDELLASNRRWYEHTIEAFGPDRCMFGSNFPVDSLYSDYETLLRAHAFLVPKAHHEQVFETVARRFYRLDG